MVRGEGDVVGWVAVLGCDAEGEAGVGKKGIDCWGEGAGFLHGERAVLVGFVSIELVDGWGLGRVRTGGQKSSCMSTIIKAAFILDSGCCLISTLFSIVIFVRAKLRYGG